jgi:hypothetical protein
VWKADPAETRYVGAVDVERAADLYAKGWTLRQIGAELGPRRPRSAIICAVPASLCVVALPHIRLPPNRSCSSVIRASPGVRWPNRSA